MQHVLVSLYMSNVSYTWVMSLIHESCLLYMSHRVMTQNCAACIGHIFSLRDMYCSYKDMSMYVERYAHVCRKICACMSNTIHADIFGHIFSLLVISLVYVICIVRVCPIQYMLISLYHNNTKIWPIHAHIFSLRVTQMYPISSIW